MNSVWEKEFKQRMDKFRALSANHEEELSISIKIRVTNGCFHREHSPEAYKMIDQSLISCRSEESLFSFVEHESGPEILGYLALGTAGITLAKSLIDLIIAIIKARSEGIKKGDRPDAPIEIIVRGFHDDGNFYEETILRFDSRDPVSRDLIEKTLNNSIGKISNNKKGKGKRKS